MLTVGGAGKVALDEIGADLVAATPGIAQRPGEIQALVQAEVAVGAVIQRSLEGVAADEDAEVAEPPMAPAVEKFVAEIAASAALAARRIGRSSRTHCRVLRSGCSPRRRRRLRPGVIGLELRRARRDDFLVADPLGSRLARTEDRGPSTRFPVHNSRRCLFDGLLGADPAIRIHLLQRLRLFQHPLLPIGRGRRTVGGRIVLPHVLPPGLCPDIPAHSPKSRAGNRIPADQILVGFIVAPSDQGILSTELPRPNPRRKRHRSLASRNFRQSRKNRQSYLIYPILLSLMLSPQCLLCNKTEVLSPMTSDQRHHLATRYVRPIIPAMPGPEMDKIVVLARGLGSRMRRNEAAAGIDGRQAAMADAGIKAMIPIGRPFLDYVLSAAADAGYRHVCLVIGPEHNAIREYYGRSGRRAAGFHVRQPGGAEGHGRRRGRGRGVRRRRARSRSSIPTTIIPSRRCAACASSRAGPWRCSSATPCSPAATCPPNGIKRFAVAKIDAAGRLERILEKPDEATLAALPQAALAEHELLAVRAVDLRGVPGDSAVAPRRIRDHRRRCSTPSAPWARRSPR